MAEIYTLGAGFVIDPSGKQVPPQARALLEIDPENDNADQEDAGTVAMFGALGFTGLPAPPDKDGHAEGIIMHEVGQTGTCVAARDTRCADVVGKLKSGETAMYCTGGNADTRSRVICKPNLAAIILGKGKAIVSLDGKNEKLTITGWGRIFEMSEANGITLGGKNGKGGIKIDDNGNVFIWGTSVNLGGMMTPGTPATAVIMGPSGITGVPAPNVYITM